MGGAIVVSILYSKRFLSIWVSCGCTLFLVKKKKPLLLERNRHGERRLRIPWGKRQSREEEREREREKSGWVYVRLSERHNLGGKFFDFLPGPQTQNNQKQFPNFFS